MALDFLLQENKTLTTHDKFEANTKASNACQVVIECPGKKRRIYAMLSGPLAVKGEAKWTGLFGGGLGGSMSQALDLIENVGQFTNGISIRQPWFGRKYYEGTQPLRFTIPLQLVSFTNAYDEVFKPMMDLLALVFPKLIAMKRGASGHYRIPGPSLTFNRDKTSDKGDFVTFEIGKFLFFRGCYIHSITANIENSFSTDGYPHSIKLDVDFETMDASYVDDKNDFMGVGFRDASVGVDNIVSELFGFVGTVAGSGVESIKTISRGFVNSIKSLRLF